MVNAVMQDLRVRFGAILALALLPLLVFTIWQTYYNYNRDSQVNSNLMEDAAQSVASEIVNTLDVSKTILKLMGDRVTDENCVAELTFVGENLPRVYTLIAAKGDGTVVCSLKPVRRPEGVKVINSSLSPSNPISIDLMNFDASIDSPDRVLMVTRGLFDNGVLQRVLTVGYDVALLNRLRDRTILPDGSEVSVFSPQGSFVLGPYEVSKVVRESWARTAKEGGRFESDYVDELGHTRTLKVLPTLEAEIFIAMSAPKQDIFSWNRVNPFASAAIPILAWMFGFLAIWMATDKLILVHLRTMRRALLIYSRGDLDARIDNLKNPPSSIRELARSFNLLMTRISDRDARLTDSLHEKENLLREIHHRVKNNLQIIISLLNMQERKMKGTEGAAAIRESRNRINAIALVHKALYESSDIRMIPMESFLSQMVRQLSRAMGLSKQNISVALDVKCSPMDSDRATPVALFIVEAVTNSVKHGVQFGDDIRVSVHEDVAQIFVRVEDSGTKTDTSISGDALPIEETGSGTGTKLMAGFARQLSGTHKVGPSDFGYVSELVFPKSNRSVKS